MPKRKIHKPEEIIQHLRTHELNKEYGGLRVDQAKRLKELERENAQLKRALANEVLDKRILQEALSGNY